MTETALEPANCGNAKTEQTLGDGACVHDVGGCNEQRHCKQDKTLVKTLQDLLACQGEIKTGSPQIHQRCQDDGVSNRRSDPGQSEKGDQAKGKFHAHTASSPC